MRKRKKRPGIDWKSLIAQAMLDLIVGLILLIIEQLLE